MRGLPVYISYTLLRMLKSASWKTSRWLLSSMETALNEALELKIWLRHIPKKHLKLNLNQQRFSLDLL
jgi:hypothetical protein